MNKLKDRLWFQITTQTLLYLALLVLIFLPVIAIVGVMFGSICLVFSCPEEWLMDFGVTSILVLVAISINLIISFFAMRKIAKKIFKSNDQTLAGSES